MEDDDDDEDVNNTPKKKLNKIVYRSPNRLRSNINDFGSEKVKMKPSTDSVSKMDYINHLDQLLRSESPNLPKKYNYRQKRDDLPELDHLRYNGNMRNEESYSTKREYRDRYSDVKKTPDHYQFRNIQSDPFDTPNNHIQQSYRHSKQEYIPQKKVPIFFNLFRNLIFMKVLPGIFLKVPLLMIR